MRRVQPTLGVLLLSLCACDGAQSTPEPGSGQDGQFDDGVATPGKADTQGFEDRGYEAMCILRLANEADEALLSDEADVWSVSAGEIAEARAGADGELGTADDVRFDSLEQLDDVDWVGYFAFQNMFAYAQQAGYCPALGEEYEFAGEAEAADRIIRRIGERMQREYAEGARPATRGLHAKGRCFRAEFTVDNGALPPQLRVGVFAQNQSYPAWVRFSNGNPHVQADAEGDVRAMSIKLMGVPGEKLLEDEADALTHDFLLNHTPAVPTADVFQFADVVDATEDGKNPVLAWLDWNPFDIETESIRLAIEAITKSIINPLSTPYWSQTPYRLGPETSAVKYRAQPCEGWEIGRPADEDDPDGFTVSMQDQLQLSDACFEFAIQRQTDPQTMPMEDGSIEWSESASPFVPVARIYIAEQDFTSEDQAQTCEHLSFTPWHALPEHRPLGSLNRARRRAYAAISGVRHGLNGVPQVEPTE